MSCKWDRDAESYLSDGEPCVRDEYGDPTRHCTARRSCSAHIGTDELTCPRCIARTRAIIRRITPLSALMIPVALTTGVDSEAASLAGPAADTEAWTWRKVAARQGRAWHLSLIEDDDDQHPFSVLTRWALMIAEDYGHDLPTLTVSNAADYLDRHLARIAQDGEQDFPLLTREVRKSQRHLESVLSTAVVKQRGAPCPECAGDLTQPAPRLVREPGHWCDDEACEQLHYDTDEADLWVCPRNKAHSWTVEAYENYVTERKVQTA